MKNYKIRKLIFLLFLLMGFSITILAQGPPPPPGDHGQNTNQPAGPGGSAPIGSAITLMLGLFGAYGFKKAWDKREKLNE